MTQEKYISDFTLQYDGMYHITWNDGDKTHKWYVHLDLFDLLSMLEIEGITKEEIFTARKNGGYNALEFKKVRLKYFLDDGRFETYGFFDEWLDNTIVENFTVELFLGDSIKNHQYETLIGNVEVVDSE
jgi:hypothetical protein